METETAEIICKIWCLCWLEKESFAGGRLSLIRNWPSNALAPLGRSRLATATHAVLKKALGKDLCRPDYGRTTG